MNRTMRKSQKQTPLAYSAGHKWLKDRVIIVTGGSRGIGRAIVLELCRLGARVVFTYLHQDKAAEDLSRQAAELGHEPMHIQADVKDLKRAEWIIEQTIGKYERLDGLVNNAGITRDKSLMMMSPSDWQDVIDTNLTGTFNACRAAIVTLMKQRFGRIVNIASISGIAGIAGQVNYCSSKAGVIGLTKALAREVAPYGITVNAIAPGYIESDMTNGISVKRTEELYQAIPAGRFGKPEEIAEVVSMLLNPNTSYITGQVLIVDGGLTL